MTQRKLERLCRLWQKRLRLVDWKIKELVLIDPQDEAEMRKAATGRIPLSDSKTLLGLTLHEPSEMEVDKISILNDEYAERTLIHELLHLRLAPFTGILRDLAFKLNKEDKSAQEQAINLLADTYLQAYGESTGKK